MAKPKRRFPLALRMYLFIVMTVLLVAGSVCFLSYYINADQIDTYFKRLTENCSSDYASRVDAEFLKELRAVAESDEYQAIRDKAEEEDDDTACVEYLKEKGLWDRYVETREDMITYFENMDDLKYIYLIVWGDADSETDMYLIDADDVPFYQTGYYEIREDEFAGVEPDGSIPPVISNGDWGWLCSAYTAVYDDEGNIVCHVGCDVGMEDIMSERITNLSYSVLAAIICTFLVFTGAFFIISKTVVNPLRAINKAMTKFNPGEGKDYDTSGVIDLEMMNNDEIADIYEGIRTMQKKNVDYINSLTNIRQEKQKTEDYLKKKKEQISDLSAEAYKDSLTGIGNKASYYRKIEEINRKIKEGLTEVAIVMMDINCLKDINDNHGHSAGDTYIKGCVHVICDVFMHSPVYRIGGDEFVAILTGEDYENRHDKVRELQAAFAKSYARTGVDPWLRYSASVGVAELSSEDNTLDLVFKRADKYMYQDKMQFKEKNGLLSERRN